MTLIAQLFHRVVRPYTVGNTRRRICPESVASDRGHGLIHFLHLYTFVPCKTILQVIIPLYVQLICEPFEKSVSQLV